MSHLCRINFRLAFLLGILLIGCKSEHNGKVNQVDKYGNKQGPWEIYSDSILIEQGTYIDGEPDGLWTYWYRDGHIMEEGHYDNGVKNGMWVKWYQDGSLMWKGEWENGKRHVGYPDAKAEIIFLGEDHPENVLAKNTTYRLRIRILNIPISHLFVEVNGGSITRDTGQPDQFILNTSSDTTLRLAIGYVPDLEFRDFRNLVREIDFKIR